MVFCWIFKIFEEAVKWMEKLMGLWARAMR